MEVRGITRGHAPCSRARMHRARLEALFVGLLAACGTSEASSGGDGGTDGSSGGSSGVSTGPCGAANAPNAVTYDFASTCRAYVARAADAGSDDAGDAGDADAGETDAGLVDAGSDDTCVDVTCQDLCQLAQRLDPKAAGYVSTCDHTGTQLSCTFQLPCGRRFSGMDEPVGCVLAAATYLEAASIIAFEHLARDLAFHGAPEELVLGALQSKADEERHAATMRALCDERGVFVLEEPRATRWRPRSLFEVARENAVEGCVGETWGALVALAQGRFAKDARVRETMTAIASDELDHAALAHAIDAWVRPLLRADDLRRLDEDVAAARARLALDAPRAVDPASADDLGIPSGAVAAELVAQVFAALSPSASPS